MKQSIIHITLLVENYDEAIDFYVKKTKVYPKRRYAAVRLKTLGACSAARLYRLLPVTSKSGK